MSSERIHHLDWLKALIVYGIVVYHVSLVFAYGGWLVNNFNERSLLLSGFAAFCFPWGIPAMFLIAGADAWFGLRSHSVSDFLRKRFLRLVVPLVPGLLILSPLQRFIASDVPPPSIDRFPAFYVAFFQNMQFNWSLQVVGRYWIHLWFLLYLFVISLICAPVLRWLHTPRGRVVTARIADEAMRRGVMLFVLPLVLTQVALRPFWPSYQDWADFAMYTIVFLWGAVIFSDRRFEQVIRSQISSIMSSALISSVVLGSVLLLLPYASPVPDILKAVAWSFFVWSWLHTVLYLGIRWLNKPNRVIDYAQQSVLPVYVIHHPYVLLVASFVVTWDLGIWAKFGIVAVAVFALTLATYEFCVRRWNPARIVFGLEPKSAVRRREPPARLPDGARGGQPASPTS